MIKINKRTSTPDFFEAWKTEYKDKFQKDSKYADLIGEVKQLLKTALYDEQHGLCCYCCKEVSYPYPYAEDSHIEHFRPKGVKLYENISLDYTNLHVSCSGYKETRENCGHKKDNWFDEKLTVSPLEEGVEKLFSYTVDGHIRAVDGNERAEVTIKKLELDSFSLRRLRTTAIYICGLFDDDFDNDKRSRIIYDYKTPLDGKLKSFCNAVTYCVANA